jgi:hypothetical protein
MKFKAGDVITVNMDTPLVVLQEITVISVDFDLSTYHLRWKVGYNTHTGLFLTDNIDKHYKLKTRDDDEEML